MIDYQEWITLGINLMTVAMLLLAIYIANARTVKTMIDAYQLQSSVLVLVTLLTSIGVLLETADPGNLFVAVVVVFPIVRIAIIKPSLARATVELESEVAPPPDRRLSWLFFSLHRLFSDPDAVRLAEPDWLQHGRSRLGQGASIFLSLGLTFVAYLTAFLFFGESRAIDNNSLAVSMALLLIGMLTMFNKEDILSQIIGLLVMENGLFLAAVKVIAIPAVAVIFIVSMFAYIILTLFILRSVLLELHKSSHSIELDAQTRLKG